ncbi:Cytochrome b561 [Methylobacterium cerastii]|uniref:Cytochrome b561 n=2 Tax=Methylobacterium TaxID=407 RepID=A0ABQ4QJD4_9HYPH|nr:MULTISPECIES: cytochrome b [Methylobacterium]TXN11223.1 cytochrome b [Methylobacterium sp. WL122]TXN79202.1 cytochrome b [Methylobacterium sp. WL8]GJD44935.1 Cytochrome b561 [Methylobacterium cerastii]
MARWLDTPERYGPVSRGFHWLMAALFAWQFTGALLYVGIGDTALTRFVGSSHFTLGFTLFVLVLLRGAWGLANLRRRPPHPGQAGRAAVAGHALIYALMVIVPGISLLRQYGSGKGFSPYGIPLMPVRDEKIAWMMIPGDLFHYWLGFVLMAVVLGHVVMSVLHRVLWKEDVLARMA